MKVYLTASALIRLREAAYYHEEQREGYGDKFLTAYEDIKELLRQFPEAGFHLSPRVRRIPFKKFSYVIYYTIHGDELWILALRHGRQRPLNWERVLGIWQHMGDKEE